MGRWYPATQDCPPEYVPDAAEEAMACKIEEVVESYKVILDRQIDRQAGFPLEIEELQKLQAVLESFLDDVNWLLANPYWEHSDVRD